MKDRFTSQIVRWFTTSLLVCVLITAWADTPGMAPQSLEQRIEEKARLDVTAVKPWLDRYGYGVVFATVGVEGFGIPAPGQTVLIAGALSATAQTRIQLEPLVLIAFLASVLGNSVGYGIGRWGGRSLLKRLRFSEDHVRRIEQGFTRYGGGLIVVSRFFDGLRQLNGITAGILKMPWWTFTLYNVAGAALWVGCWGVGVYALDEHWHAILSAIRMLNPWVALISLCAALLFFEGIRLSDRGQSSN